MRKMNMVTVASTTLFVSGAVLLSGYDKQAIADIGQNTGGAVKHTIPICSEKTVPVGIDAPTVLTHMDSGTTDTNLKNGSDNSKVTLSQDSGIIKIPYQSGEFSTIDGLCDPDSVSASIQMQANQLFISTENAGFIQNYSFALGDDNFWEYQGETNTIDEFAQSEVSVNDLIDEQTRGKMEGTGFSFVRNNMIFPQGWYSPYNTSDNIQGNTYVFPNTTTSVSIKENGGSISMSVSYYKKGEDGEWKQWENDFVLSPAQD